jgi:hypothetical protein
MVVSSSRSSLLHGLFPCDSRIVNPLEMKRPSGALETQFLPCCVARVGARAATEEGFVHVNGIGIHLCRLSKAAMKGERSMWVLGGYPCSARYFHQAHHCIPPCPSMVKANAALPRRGNRGKRIQSRPTRPMTSRLTRVRAVASLVPHQSATHQREARQAKPTAYPRSLTLDTSKALSDARDRWQSPWVGGC